MVVQPIVSRCDQSSIETIGRDAGFACADQQDCPPARIERIGDTPLTVAYAESQLLHVLVPRPLQCIGMRPTKHRSDKFESCDRRCCSLLNVVAPVPEFIGERVEKFDDPSHGEYSLYAIWAPLSKCRIAVIQLCRNWMIAAQMRDDPTKLQRAIGSLRIAERQTVLARDGGDEAIRREVVDHFVPKGVDQDEARVEMPVEDD